MPAPSPGSLIDQVDRDDRPVGVVPRGEALTVGANFRTVHVFVVHDDQLLLQKLAPTRERHPDHWGSSVAAYLFAGETYEAAARRRMAEELGLVGDLVRIGKTYMEDERSLKFIELYAFEDGPATIRDPGHIAELRYWNEEALDLAIDDSSAIFTPTFLTLYRFYRQRLATTI